MQLVTVTALVALAMRARATAVKTFSIPLDLRGMDTIDFDVDDDPMPWGDEDNAPPGVKVPGDNPLYLCGQDDSGDIVKIKSIDFSPATPVRGAELVVSALGDVASTINKGTTVRVQVRLAGSKVVDKKYDLCEGLKRFGHSCPFTPGSVNITKGFTIPKRIPHGRYGTRIKVETPDKKQVTCLTGIFKM